MIPFPPLPLRRRISAFPNRLLRVMTYSSKSAGYELLMNCMTHRWLYNDKTQLALRRLNFDLEGLVKVAAEASGASQCTEIEVLAEGSYNRIYCLKFRSGQNVIARIPFRHTGPRGLLTRSEVATMDFVRSRFGAPVPKVLAWNASSDNQVGCEYIIMEKCSGDVLDTHLNDAPASSQHIFGVAKLYDNLASVPFSQYGSIYYKEDVDSLLQARPLYADGVPTDASAERFRIGPSVERRFYRGERARMSIDRGPWTNVHSYIKAAVDCEVKWLQSYTKTSSARRQLGARHTADQHISVLKKWLLLAPAVAPSMEYCVPVLSHPDMHAGNIFVNHDDSLSLAGVIDWQGAAVRPLFETDTPTFLFSPFTQGLRYEYLPNGDLPPPLFPDDYNELNTSSQQETLAAYRQVESHHHFFKLIKQMQPKLYKVMLLRHMEDLRGAMYHSSHTWSHGLPRLEQSLISLATAYGDHIPVSTKYPGCPVIFSEEDMDRNRNEFCDIVLHEHLLESHFLDVMKTKGFRVNPDGRVSAEEFEEAQEAASEILKRAIKDMGEELVGRHWPVREGKLEPTMESCV